MTEPATAGDRPRYWRTSDGEGVRDYPSFHEGEGVIRVKSFFDGQTTTGLHFHVWELPPGATEGRHTHPAENPKDNWEELYYVLAGQGVATFDDGEETALDVARLRLAAGDDSTAEWLHAIEQASGAPHRTSDLAIDGSDLMTLGLAEGPRIGEVLATLVARVVEDPALNTREQLIEEARGLL